jgi:hypothetical protein
MKYMKYKSILLVVVLLAFGAWNKLKAQAIPPKIAVSKDYFHREGLELEEALPYIEAIETHLSKLIFSMDFSDEKGQWSDEKYILYSTLFNNDAMVDNLLRSPAILQRFYEYTNFAYEYIRPGSLAIKFNFADITSLKRNKSGDVEADLEISLDLFTSVNKKGELIQSVKGRTYKLTCKLILESDPTKIPQIIKLGGTTLGRSEEVKLGYLSLQGGVDIGQLNAMQEFGFKDLQPRLQSYGGEIQYSRGLNKKNSLLAWTRLGISLLNVSADLEGKYTASPSGSLGNVRQSLNNVTVIDSKGVPAEQQRNYVLFLESLEAQSQENIRNILLYNGLLGIQYLKEVNTKVDILLGLGMLFTFNAGGNDGKRDVRYSGYFLPENPGSPLMADSRFFSEKELRELGLLDEYYRSSAESIVTDRVQTGSQWSYGLLLQPTLRWKIGFRWGVDLSLQYFYGLENTFSYESGQPKPFLGRGAEGERISILDDYATDSRAQWLGGRLGVYFRFGDGL